VEGDPVRARALFGQSLRVFGDLGEPGGTAEGLVGIAAVDAATGHRDRAAMLVGAGQRLRESFAGRELPLERRTSAHYLQRAEQELGADAWSTARGRGSELPLDVVIGLALTSD
jgi:hypothetical protein